MKKNNPSAAPESIDTLTIFTMLVRCPRSGPPSEACPFTLFRDKYNIEEKFQLAESFPQGQRQEMMAIHNHCLAAAYAKPKGDN